MVCFSGCTSQFTVNVVALVSSNGRQREALSTTQQLGFSSRWRKLDPSRMLPMMPSSRPIATNGSLGWRIGFLNGRWSWTCQMRRPNCHKQHALQLKEWSREMVLANRKLSPSNLQMGETYCNCGIMTWLFNAVYISVVSPCFILHKSGPQSWF